MEIKKVFVRYYSNHSFQELQVSCSYKISKNLFKYVDEN